MHIAITAGLLADQLTWISRTLPTTPAIPVLAGVRLEAGNDRVHLTATDYETWSHATVEADTQGAPATVVVPGRLLAERGVIAKTHDSRKAPWALTSP